MNKHFDDDRYYLKRTGEHAKPGVREAIEPTETKLRELSGTEREPDPSPLEQLTSDPKDVERDSEGEARKMIADARKQVESYRSKK